VSAVFAAFEVDTEQEVPVFAFVADTVVRVVAPVAFVVEIVVVEVVAVVQKASAAVEVELVLMVAALG